MTALAQPPGRERDRPPRLRSGVRDLLREPLNRTSLSLVTSTLLTAALGVGFWAVAARLYSPETLGRDSALIAALTAIAGLCQLNLVNVIVRFLPQIRRPIGRRVIQAYAAAAAASLLVSTGFVFLAPLASRQFLFLSARPVLAAGFVLSTTAWTVFSLQDAVLTALRKAPWLPIENGLFSGAKLILLPLGLGAFGAFGAFAAWVLPMFASVAIVNWLIARRVIPQAAREQRHASGVVDVFGWRRLLRFLAQDLVGNALGQIVMTVLPLLVVGLLGAKANAYFYLPFTLVVTFDLMFQALATSLTTEAARAPERLPAFIAMVMRRLWLMQIPAALALVVAAPVALAVFGHAYVEHSTTLLRMLALASCFRAVSALFSAMARLRGNGAQLLAVQAGSLVLLLSAVPVLAPRYGVDGVGAAWLLAASVVAVAALPSLRRFRRDAVLAAVAGGGPTGGRPVAGGGLTGGRPVAGGGPTGGDTDPAPRLTNGHLPAEAFEHGRPTEVGILELEAGLRPRRAWSRGAGADPAYEDAIVLVRLHGEPLGVLHFEAALSELSEATVATRVWSECANRIERHVQAHGCQPPPSGPHALGDLAGTPGADGALPALPGASVAVIVPTGGRAAQFRRMLDSMLAIAPADVEILVVDNRPGADDTPAVVSDLARRHPRLRYVAEPRPGSSVARNRGLSETGADIVVFTDDDVVVDGGWLHWLLAPFADPSVTAATGMVLPLSLDAPAQKHFERYAGFSKGVERRVFDLDVHRADNRLLYPYWGGIFGSGNSMAFRRQDLVAAGGFDPALGAGSVALAGADIEAMSAAILRGGRLVYEPRSVCWHEHRASEAALRRQLFNYGVGFTAILTKGLLTDRRFLGAFARSLRLAVALRRQRRAEATSPVQLPPELARLQRRGMLSGPLLYLRSVRWARRLRLGDAVIGR